MGNRLIATVFLAVILFHGPGWGKSPVNQWTIPDTGQSSCYSTTEQIECSQDGWFGGQDGAYQGPTPSYRDHGDGTVTDRVTGLMWSKGIDPRKVSLHEAGYIAAQMDLGGYRDWRVPNIKELYSLIDFRGDTGFSRESEMHGQPPDRAVPYINTDYFDFLYGDVSQGERYIDAQWLSSTEYVSTTMHGNRTLFGVNFADGRIKGYGYRRPHGGEKRFYARYVRGPSYGNNLFEDNGNGTVTDHATGLMWMQQDSGREMSWEDALSYAEGATHAGYDDWRLPNIKELQSIVDYSRAPDVTGSAAIDPLFQTSIILNEAGEQDFPYFWSSTTHLDGPVPANKAAYIAFGRALGRMRGEIMDVHGAGAQRSAPKRGRSMFRGPQGDAVRPLNWVRLVRGGSVGNSRPYIQVQDGRYPDKIRMGSRVPLTNNRGSGQEVVMPHFIRRLDRDGDGRVSRREFDGPPDRFDFHDRNGDGYLSAMESPRFPPPHLMNRRPGFAGGAW